MEKSTSLLERRIAELETQIRGVGLGSSIAARANFSSGSCTNNCTAACTIGCTKGCTGSCVAEQAVEGLAVNPSAERVAVETFQKLMETS